MISSGEEKFIDCLYDRVKNRTNPGKELIKSLKNNVPIEDMIMEDDMKLNVQRLLDNARLTDKEKDIISERYGFNGKNPKTLEEIGKKYGITRERVRQIEAKIFIKLRQVRDINNYMIYLHDDDKLLKKVK